MEFKAEKLEDNGVYDGMQKDCIFGNLLPFAVNHKHIVGY